jgi:hypothetical protein
VMGLLRRGLHLSSETKHDRHSCGSAERYPRSAGSFSPQIKLAVFIFWENITYCSKRYPFSAAFKLCFKEIFENGKNGSSNFL